MPLQVAQATALARHIVRRRNGLISFLPRLTCCCRNYATAGQHYAKEKSVPRRIHILGAGSIGKLIAHSLRGDVNPPPITLIFHRPALLSAWHQSTKEIVLESDGHRVSSSGFDVELAIPPRRSHGRIVAGSAQTEDSVSDSPIDNLIVAVKAPVTVSAIQSIKHRLRPESSVCFLQNGMGIIDNLNESVFPDPSTRPNYIQGIVTHGVNAPVHDDPFFAVHAGHGTISLAALPRFEAKEDAVHNAPFAPTSRYLLRTLTGVPVLGAVGIPPLDFFQQQLEKVAANAVINPLTVLFDAPNGSILYNFAATRTMRLLLAEISLIIRSLPELRGLPNVQDRFSPERLETIIVGIADKTRRNVSSMLADVRAGRKTEVEWINGYIVRRGEELGLQAVCNYMMQQLVTAKVNMIQRENLDQVPDEKPDITA